MPSALYAVICAILFFPAYSFADDFTPERFDCSNSQRYYMVRVPSLSWPKTLEAAQIYSDAVRIDLAGRWKQGLPIWDYGEQRFCDLALLPAGKALTIVGDYFGDVSHVFGHFGFRAMHTFDANADGVQEIALIAYVDGGFYQVTILGGCPESYYIPVGQFIAFRLLQNGSWIKPEDFVFADSDAWPEFVVKGPAQLSGKLYSKQKNWAQRQWRFTAKAGMYTETVIKRLPEE